MADRESNIVRRGDESLTEPPLRDINQSDDLNDPGAGAGSVDEARVAEKGAGDHSPFDPSDAQDSDRPS